jgi:drug/metabolite transporter (DMT)-like permease
MAIRHILGIFLFVAGVALLYFGYQESQTLGEKVYESFAGRFTDSTTWYLLIGAASSLCGLILLIIRPGHKA